MSPHTSPGGVPTLDSGETEAVGTTPRGRVRERVATLEFRIAEHDRRIAEHDRRLGEGSRTFAEIRSSIERVELRIAAELKEFAGELKPKRMSGLQLASVLIAALAFGGGLVWAAARYPERTEFSELSRQVQALSTSNTLLSRDVADLRESIRQLQTHITKGGTP